MLLRGSNKIYVLTFQHGVIGDFCDSMLVGEWICNSDRTRDEMMFANTISLLKTLAVKERDLKW